jgi:putative pyruvate formate lyase activating enzyme
MRAGNFRTSRSLDAADCRGFALTQGFWYNSGMDRAAILLRKCELCPRRCKVNRSRGQRGYCGLGSEILVAHYGPHFGEEPPVSGTKGSGNIFFVSCNLRCVYCQNYQISQSRTGNRYTIHDLSEMFLSLERDGVHNINLVSPTPYVPLIAAAIREARKGGLTIPFVYNSNAFENVETLQSLKGLIEIYLPDFKYWNSKIGRTLSDVKDYARWAKAAILEMKAQVGDLIIEKGIARKGLLIRHLVLPNNLAGSREVLGWIREHLGIETYVSLMSQYIPLHGAQEYPMLNRRVSEEEYDHLLDAAREYGLQNVFIQDLESAPLYVPDFNKEAPFEASSEALDVAAPH